MTPEARMRAVFDALKRDDMDDLISHWASDGIYYNPSVGPPAHGSDAVKTTVGNLSKTLQGRGETIVVDRFIYGADTVPIRAFAEWHIETGDPASPRQGKQGLHVVSFNDEGLLHRVTVFSHP